MSEREIVGERVVSVTLDDDECALTIVTETKELSVSACGSSLDGEAWLNVIVFDRPKASP